MVISYKIFNVLGRHVISSFNVILIDDFPWEFSYIPITLVTAVTDENNKNHLGNNLNPCFSLLIRNNRFAVNIPRGDTFTRSKERS